MLTLLATPARAEWMSGAQLNEACSAKAPVDRAMCLSYVIGVLDGFRSMERPPKVPDDVSAGQVRDVVATYLASHDEAQTLQGRMVVQAAIADAWPDIQPKVAPPPKRKAPAKTTRKTRRRS
ncbi:Rap1a/Tai family immunity protein [Novosphingobium subterraneum]|uniref:Rap1a/Tai family immunity protein n=1 Tax=Novosphingobium subterraneum TaxID=48936 RepID=UPI0012E0396B|nr:Rap1a/Tai family immunity protein [Novosphingobium subterraneum]